MLTVREHTESSDFIMTTNVDATYFGSLARFANHSCEPNAELIIHREPRTKVLGVPVLAARRCIVVGEEVNSNPYPRVDNL